MRRAPLFALLLVAALLAGIWYELAAMNRAIAAPPCIVASAAGAPPQIAAAPATPAERRARLRRQAREIEEWQREFDFLMRHARTAARDPEMPPR